MSTRVRLVVLFSCFFVVVNQVALWRLHDDPEPAPPPVAPGWSQIQKPR